MEAFLTAAGFTHASARMDEIEYRESRLWRLLGNPMIYQASRAGVIWSVVFWILALVVLYLLLYQWGTLTRQKSLS